MTTLVYIRLIRVFSGLMFIGFLASSFFTMSVTFVDKRFPIPVEQSWDGPAIFRSVLMLGPHEGMLLALMLMIGSLFFGIYLMSKLSEDELARIGEDVKFYRGLRAFKWKHVVLLFTYVRDNFWKLLLMGLEHIFLGLKYFFIPGYIFQKMHFRSATVRKLDPKKDQVSMFGGRFLSLSVPADRAIMAKHPDYTHGTAHDYVRVSKRLYNCLKNGDTLPVFVQYYRYAPWMAKIRIAH